MPTTARANLFKLIAWFLPLACRGLALGFAILAVTVLFGIGDDAGSDRYFTAGLYAAIAVGSFAFGVVAGRILRRPADGE